MIKPPKPLTPKQERFAQVVASGKSQAEAYRTAYDVSPDTPDKSIHEVASRIASDIKVKSRILELKQELASKILWTKEQSVKILAKIAEEQAEMTKDKIAAIKELNAMHGHNAPTKVDLTGEVFAENKSHQSCDLFGHRLFAKTISNDARPPLFVISQ